MTLVLVQWSLAKTIFWSLRNTGIRKAILPIIRNTTIGMRSITHKIGKITAIQPAFHVTISHCGKRLADIIDHNRIMSASMAILQEIMFIREILIVSGTDINRFSLIEQLKTVLVC